MTDSWRWTRTLRPAASTRILSVLTLVALLSLIGVSDSRGQSSVLEIVSPVPGQMLGSEDLLIVVNVRGSYVIDPRSVQLFIDDDEYTDEVKVSDRSIRFLLRDGSGRRLRPGSHTARIVASLPDGTDVGNLEWHFMIDGAQRTAATNSRSRPSLPIRGTTYVGTRNSDISGDAALRQQPASVYAVRADLRAEAGAFSFPFKAYVTTNESSSSQPRNRFLIGAESKHLTVLLGDTSPAYSPLALDNTRTRGLLAEVYLKPLRLSMVRGQIRRGISSAQPTDQSTLASPLLSSYERTMTAARLSVGGERSVLFSLHALKASDDTTSVTFGSRPIENIVSGGDLEINVLKGRFGAAAGAAMSLTTEDISRGIADRAQIDSLFDVDLPFDPSDFRRIITLNTSTVPIRLDKLTSLAWYSNIHAKAIGHAITAEYRSIGGSYFSAGNPFLINDRKMYTISDRFRHADGRVFGVLRYMQYENFDDNEFVIPLDNRTWSANVTVAPRTKVPTLSGGFRRQERSQGTVDLPLSDSRLDSYSFGISQQFRIVGNRQSVQVLGMRSTRFDRVQPGLDNVSLTGTVGLTNQISSTLSTSVRYTRVNVRYENLGDEQLYQTGTGDVYYQLKMIPLDLAAGARYTRSSGSEIVSPSKRYGGQLTAEYEIQRNMLIELGIGVDAYRDDVLPQAQYTERYITLRHRYTF